MTTETPIQRTADNLWLEYQPIYYVTKSGRHELMDYEALMRGDFTHSTMNIVQRLEQFYESEESNKEYWRLIDRELDKLFARQTDAHVFVNVEPIQCMFQGTKDYLKGIGNTDQIGIEITERWRSDANPLYSMQQIIAFLHRNDFQVALDDIGSGVFSTELTNQLIGHVDRIKTSLLGCSQATIDYRVKYWSKLGAKYGVQVVFEGIDNQEMANHILQLMGTDWGFQQGYFWGRPGRID